LWLPFRPGAKTLRRVAPILRFLLPSLAVLLLAGPARPETMNPQLHHLFIGTYSQKDSKGIYAVEFDAATGRLSAPTLAAATRNPSFLALSPDRKHLYAVSESEAMAVAFNVSAEHAQLTALQEPQPARGKAPCHLVVDATGRTLLVANYHTGIVASLAIQPDGTLGAPGSVIERTGSGPDRERQSTAHAHCVVLSPDNRFVFSCDLGLDKIFAYRLDAATATLSPAATPFTATAPGSGPRHFAFAPDGRHAFVITEMGGTITSFGYDAANGALTALDTQSTLDPHSDFHGKNGSAAIRVHPNGRFVYGSNRGPDNLAVFAFDAATGRLTPVEFVPSGGKSPRDFVLSPDGCWLIAAHQDSDSLTVFRVDPQSGRLTRTAATATISMPVCVMFAD
jgi:6-phosphogluconolactonase